MLIYQDESLEPVGYTNSDFQSDIDFRKSTIGVGAISWRSVKQSSIADSIMKAEYIVASKAIKEAV